MVSIYRMGTLYSRSAAIKLNTILFMVACDITGPNVVNMYVARGGYFSCFFIEGMSLHYSAR